MHALSIVAEKRSYRRQSLESWGMPLGEANCHARHRRNDMCSVTNFSTINLSAIGVDTSLIIGDYDQSLFVNL